jgi:ABC-type sulfate transport system permease subunit
VPRLQERKIQVHPELPGTGLATVFVTFLPFVAGLVAIFVSGGQALYMIAGDALDFLVGIAFLKMLK